MALDPRKFIIKDCRRGTQEAIRDTHDRKYFSEALGKIGDIEAFNSNPDASKIAQGLRTISSVSDAIRDGEGGPSGLLGIGNFLGGSLDAGAGWVLDNVGIAKSAVTAVSGLNPGVANRALDQAKSVFEKTTNGEFTLDDIPDALQDLQNLDVLAGKVYVPKEATTVTTCYASPYAESLAYSYAPKYPFLFIVEFVYNDGQVSSDFPKIMAHLVKTSTRPNVRFEYEEVNMYNFRTKVVKRSEFDPMIMTFHDDQQEASLYSIYTEYLQRIAPITRFGPEANPTYEESGMDWNGQRSASTGELFNNAKTILKEIRLHHLSDYGRRINTYYFMNPKIDEMQLSDLDMASSEPTQVQIQFVYDALFVNPWKTPQDDDINLEELTKFGKWPIKYNGSSASS